MTNTTLSLSSSLSSNISLASLLYCLDNIFSAIEKGQIFDRACLISGLNME